MTRILVAAVLCALWAIPAWADTHASASCSYSDVNTAVAAASSGDTVTIPACPSGVSWAYQLVIDKAITLQGNGIDSTVIKDDGSESSELIVVTLPASVATQVTRITGMTFTYGTRTAARPFGLIRVNGASTDGRRFRMDHCKFEQLYSHAIWPFQTLGVVDNCTFNVRATVPAGVGYVKGSSWGGYDYGDGSWYEADNLGTDKFIFFEDCTINYIPDDLAPMHVSMIDAQAGGRYVVRYSTIYNSVFEGHGTESGGRERSTRAVEIYNNTFDGIDTQNILIAARGGVWIVHNNTVSGYTSDVNLPLIANRAINTFAVWGGADGESAWDVNEAGGPFATGTVGSVGTLSISVSGTPWTANQWTGYVLQRTTNVGSVTGQDFGEIVSNTTNSITYRASIGYPDPNGDLAFTAGDSFSIYKVTHVLDQPGRSGGSLVSGATPSPPAGWNDQTTSACYEWSNTVTGGGAVGFSPSRGPIRANEHYYNDTQKPGYAAYTYPHPLRGEETPSPPSAPRNVRIR